ncbi:hypothetical protein niasHT_013795 [Heterodera trifolii]|uniref:7TM GPCR serpentine receptor class x (Srx) domain-containing protein n=1 Tax=Heterodera trifolii TaxID=157864 RepID=A0ABD2KTH4_9BILA
MIITVPVMRMRTTIIFYDSNSFLFEDKDPGRPNIRYNSFLKAGSSSIFLLLALLINILTFVAYKRSKKAALNSQSAVKIEKKLLVYALLTFAGHALNAIFLIIIGTGILKNYFAMIYIHSPWINDLCSLVLSRFLSNMHFFNPTKRHNANGQHGAKSARAAGYFRTNSFKLKVKEQRIT